MSDASYPPHTPGESPYEHTTEPARKILADRGLARHVRDELVQRGHDGREDDGAMDLDDAVRKFSTSKPRLCRILRWHPQAKEWFEVRPFGTGTAWRLSVTQAGHDAMREDSTSQYPGEEPTTIGRTFVGDGAIPDGGGRRVE